MLGKETAGTRPVYLFVALAFLLLPLQMHSQAIPTVTLPPSAHKVGEKAGSYSDRETGRTVYRLSDRKLCPQGATHFYSYTLQFSIAGDMTFICAYDPQNPNLTEIPVYAKDFTLAFRDAVSASGLGSLGSDNFAIPQFSQKRRVLFALYDSKIYELDPWHRTSRVYVDFAGTLIPNHDDTTTRPTVFRDFKVGPNDEIIIEAGIRDPRSSCPYCYIQRGIITFDPRTGQKSAYSTVADGKGSDYPGFRVPSDDFDETNLSQDGRVFSTYHNRPAWGFNIDFRSSVQFRHPSFGPYGDKKYEWSAHGHMGFFPGANGRSYVVRVINDLIDNNLVGVVDQVGQVGTVVNEKWRPLFGLFNTQTGQVELVWGVQAPEMGWSTRHFSRSQRADVFYGSGATITRYQVSYDPAGNPLSVSGENLARTRSKLSCGYWAEPRAASDPSGERALFDSTMSTSVIEASGKPKTDCTTDVYVAERASPGLASFLGKATAPWNAE